MLFLFGVLFAIVICAGAILSFAQQSQITALVKEVRQLKKQMSQRDSLAERNGTDTQNSVGEGSLGAGSSGKSSLDSSSANSGSENPSYVDLSLLDSNETDSSDIPSTSSSAFSAASESVESVNDVSADGVFHQSKAKENADSPSFFKRFFSSDSSLMTSIKGNALLWLGAAVLAVGGVFLAVYSIEAGLVSAKVRVTVGAAFGLCLVGLAEYLARHREKFSIYSPTICAALASGGVITCYAIILAAYDFYQFIPPLFAFSLLAAVAFGAISLALRYGPLLALIGIAGAYAIPALIQSDSNSITTLLVFVSLVSLSGVWVSQKVGQIWPWRLSMIGHFVWAFVAVNHTGPLDIWVWLGFTTFSVYLFSFTHTLGWSLQEQCSDVKSVKAMLTPSRELFGILLPFTLLHVYLMAHGSDMHIWVSSAVLGALLLLPSYRHSTFDSWPCLLVVASIIHILLLKDIMPFAYANSSNAGGLSPNALNSQDLATLFTGYYLYVQVAVVAFTSYVAFMAHRTGRPAFWFYIVVFPIALYGVSYVVSTASAQEALYRVWAFELALLAIVSTTVALKSRGLGQFTYAVLANACLTLCLTMLLEAAVLSFALALQVASISVLSARYKVTLPDWLYKILLTAVLVRITVAPWLADYANESIWGTHWTAIIYPLIFAALMIAKKYNPSTTLKVWLEGALIHVAALFITTEPSYYLTGSYPDLLAGDYQDRVLVALGWCALAAAYCYRAFIAQSMTVLYRVAALVLLIGVGITHVDISVANNPFIHSQPTGERTVFNWLLLQWLLPALIVTSVLSSRLQRMILGTPDALNTILSKKVRINLGVIAGGFAFLYINSIIRGAFHSANLLLENGFTQPELYTYSVCWLVIATATIFIGQFKQHQLAVKLGFGLLALVILKAFVVDMANLEGLYRALSFIGLGLSLVGIGWLFQKLRGDAELLDA